MVGTINQIRFILGCAIRWLIFVISLLWFMNLAIGTQDGRKLAVWLIDKSYPVLRTTFECISNATKSREIFVKIIEIATPFDVSLNSIIRKAHGKHDAEEDYKKGRRRLWGMGKSGTFLVGLNNRFEISGYYIYQIDPSLNLVSCDILLKKTEFSKWNTGLDDIICKMASGDTLHLEVQVEQSGCFDDIYFSGYNQKMFALLISSQD